MRGILFFLLCIVSVSAVQLVPMPRTPEANAVQLTIVFPRGGEIDENPVDVQLRLYGYPIGTDSSSFPRYKDLYNDPDGQSIHIVVDDRPYFPETGPSIAPYDEEGNFRESTYRFALKGLGPGMHTIRVFLARSYGESLKGDGCFAETFFFVSHRKYNRELGLQGPYLTYNEPSAHGDYLEGMPVLLDFYLTNVKLSQDGYKVRVTMDRKLLGELSDWMPYYIYGLRRGKHAIRLQLIDADRRLVPGSFNDIERTFFIR